MFIQTEATPNPATLKFLPGRPVMPAGTLHIDRREAADVSPLAQALFAVDGVSAVFFGSDFVSVTKSSGEWPHLKPAILGAIMEHFMSGAPLVVDGHAEAPGTGGGRVLRSRRCGDRGDHQGTDRDPRAPGGCRRRRRHHLSRLPRRDRLSRDEGRLFRMPVFDGNAQERHPKPAAPFPAGRAGGGTDLAGPVAVD